MTQDQLNELYTILRERNGFVGEIQKRLETIRALEASIAQAKSDIVRYENLIAPLEKRARDLKHEK